MTGGGSGKHLTDHTVSVCSLATRLFLIKYMYSALNMCGENVLNVYSVYKILN